MSGLSRARYASLFGPTGIMEVRPRNTTKHGIAWERPGSLELIGRQTRRMLREIYGLGAK